MSQVIIDQDGTNLTLIVKEAPTNVQVTVTQGDAASLRSELGDFTADLNIIYNVAKL